jgi:hypothetical protein
MKRPAGARARWALGLIGLLVWGTNWAEAGGWARRHAARAVAATASVPVRTSFEPSPYPMLGTFYPSPFLMVRGNWPAGGGYSPLGIYGEASMAVYGPMSPLRGYTAPIVTYERGYDGRLIPRDATSFSTPNRPDATPVVYPTQANYFYRIRGSGEPPWWSDGTGWIDQN